VKLTIRHYYDFGKDRVVVGDDLLNPDAWDGLRTKTSGAFALPATRDEFVRAAEARPELEARARAIDAWLDAQRVRRLASYGAGGAQLEVWLHRLRPERELIVTDYGEATLERLVTVFPEVQAQYHDLRRDEPLAADMHLFHRIDTELADREWRDVYGRFRAATILVVATQVFDVVHVLLELARRPLLTRRNASSAGFVRTRAAFESLWQPTHSAQALQMHDLEAWALSPRSVKP
jgi:hypothetical protein